MGSLADQVIVVTGASSGLGRAICLEFASRRAMLVLAARDRGRLIEVARQCREWGATEAIVLPTDVTREADCKALIEQTVEHFGRLDVLVNNAGILVWGPAGEQRPEGYEELMRVNYLGAVYCTYYSLQHLVRSQGRLVAISSIAGLTGIPFAAGYAATKHALFGFFDSLRIELRNTGVSVTMIAPDFTETEIFRRAVHAGNAPPTIPFLHRKLATAEQVARQVVVAIERRRRLLVLTARGRLLRWARLLFPRLVDFFTVRAAQGK